jgi:hypothetical protein
MMTWRPSSAIQEPQPAGSSHAKIGAVASLRFPTFGQRSGSSSILQPLAQGIASAWKWMEQKRTAQVSNRRLKVAETVSLGEKRFVSILQVDGTNFLVGGAAGSVSLLAILDKQSTDKQQSTGSSPIPVCSTTESE